MPFEDFIMERGEHAKVSRAREGKNDDAWEGRGGDSHIA